VPFYIKGLGFEIPKESEISLLFARKSDPKVNLLREAIKTNQVMKSIISDYYGLHGKVEPLKIPFDKAKELLGIPDFRQINCQEIPPLKVDSQSLIESLCGESISKASLHSDNGRPTLKRTYLFNFVGQEDIKDLVYGDTISEIVDFAKFRYLERNEIASLYIDKLCELV
jgi:hypothetical protein